jgi:hypothetical protein
MKAPNDSYRNLHTGSWSIVDRTTGQVSGHPDAALILDATLVVQPAGNKRVRIKKKKHVHAFVRGTNAASLLSAALADQGVGEKWQRITYNPYKHTSFVFADSGSPIHSAPAVLLKADGTAWAMGSAPDRCP